MTGTLAAAWVIARRDFVATVYSRFFLIFLLFPIVVVGISSSIGGATGKADAEASRPKIAIATDGDSADAIKAVHDRIAEAVGDTRLAALDLVDPADDSRAQVRSLLADADRGVSAVLTGSLDHPILNAPPGTLENLGDEMRLLLADARRAGALHRAGLDRDDVPMTMVETGQSAGGLHMVRHLLARGGQFVIFFLTLLLATTTVSNLVEEKSNKVIEVLAAAVPLDAVFLGKLIAMLGVSLIGLTLWGSVAAVVLVFFKDFIGFPVMPAVGWPAFCLLMFFYFAANFMLLGSLFLGIGGQANSIREIQTLSMPLTFTQVLVFFLASATIGDNGGWLTWIGALVPFSSALTMIGLAAQSETLWIHLAALAWQVAWIALTIRIGARLFRLTVLKSETRAPLLGFLRRKKAGG